MTTLRQRSTQAFDELMPLLQEFVYSPDDTGKPSARDAFTSVVPQYQTAAASAGSLQAMAYREMGGKATNTRNPFRSQPTMSDLRIDVELAARKVLTPAENRYFLQHYLQEFLSIADANDPTDWELGADKYMVAFLDTFDYRDRDAVQAYDSGIREKLGSAFIKTGLFPLSSYFESRDCRIKREKV